ncbi:hypothetical protein YC2023_107922 [Brassica napus]
MIRGIGDAMSSTYSQTLNRWDGVPALLSHPTESRAPSGPFLTAGRWSLKLKSAKECVITHMPNQLAPKMDGAEACDLYLAVGARARPR